MRLLEIFQVSPDRQEDFTSGEISPAYRYSISHISVRRFKVLHTNNLWISIKGMLTVNPTSVLIIMRNLQALKRVMKQGMELDILTKVKQTADGQSILQVCFSNKPGWVLTSV
jgi:arginine deiminase